MATHPVQFVRIANSAYLRYLFVVHHHCEHRDQVAACIDHQRSFVVHFGKSNTLISSILTSRGEHEAGHRLMPPQGIDRRAAYLPTAIGPQYDVFCEEPYQRVQITRAGCLDELVKNLAMGFSARFESGAMFAEVLLGPTAQLATGRLLSAEHPGDFGILVVEDLAQQEDRTLKRRQLLQQRQESD